MSDAGRTLSGKVAVVFGIDDIGRGIAQRLSREGAAIALIDRDARRARAVAEEMGSDVWAAPDDAISEAAIVSAIDAAASVFRGLHVVVNNVLPIPAIASLEYQDAGAFDDAFQAVAAVRSAMQASFPYLMSEALSRRSVRRIAC